MPYSKDHKRVTRARIVRAAARRFRSTGFSGSGIGDVMAEAGLTHGGFYAHFKDKHDLLLAAIDEGFDDAEANLLGHGLEQAAGDAYVAKAARRYLTMAHRDEHGRGCVIASLGPEIARAPAPVRRRFEARLERLVQGIADRLEGPPAQRVQDARRLLSGWVGALVLSRGVWGRRTAQDLLESAGQKTTEPVG